MTAVVDHPTPYPEVNALLQQLLSSVQAVLAHCLVAMYLDGSVATGNFEPDKSDIDFVVVTDDDLSDEVFLALKHMHARLATGGSRWVTELECSYVPRRALRRRDPRPARHPTSIGAAARSPWCNRRPGTWPPATPTSSPA